MALHVMRAFCRNMLCKLVFILMKDAYGMLLYSEDAEGAAIYLNLFITAGIDCK